MTDGTPVAATTVAVAVDHDGPLCGIALLGPSGSGKTRLAVSLVDQCPFGRSQLIADDVTLLIAQERELVATAPGAIAGRAELRGTGILTVSPIKRYKLRMAFDRSEAADRHPDDLDPWRPLGPDKPAVETHPWVPGAPGLRLYLRAVLSGHSRQGAFDTVPANVGQDQRP